jgi:CRISPR-associated protein Cmr1
MTITTLELEMLTPCFAGGVQPEKMAEIRASSLRGQLRWWFRALGGFASLRPRPLVDQESMVFGWACGRHRTASPLTLRVETGEAMMHTGLAKKPVGHMPIPSAVASYFLPYLEHRTRAALAPSLPRFTLHALWRGESQLEADVRALLHVFGHWGSLGYRSRRGLGAWGFVHAPPSLNDALSHFGDPSKITVRQMPAHDAEHALQLLFQWLRKWRNYGRSPHQLNSFAPGLHYAKRDHDAGLNRQAGEVYRPALGLPMRQRFQQGTTVNWSYGRSSQPGHEGHFASPVLLRPYRLAPQKWVALVLFVDSRCWPEGKKVFLNGQPRPVSLELYEAMKKDAALRPALF